MQQYIFHAKCQDIKFENSNNYSKNIIVFLKKYVDLFFVENEDIGYCSISDHNDSKWIGANL